MEKLLFAGTWIKRKGTIDLVAAFNYLASRYPNLQLIVLGGGTSAKSVQADFPEDIRARVNCLNTANEEETARAFADADLFILPSLFEGTPLTLLEAMMSGLPIITTATCGMRDTIETERNGLLVPIRSPDDIIKATERLIKNPELRALLGRAAQAEALDKYTWERVAVPIERAYQQLCEDRSRMTHLQKSRAV
jgi:glycosyltransferase involved in cell wall biosynthesis